MDILSHILIGTIFALIFKEFTLADRILIIVFSVLPDILALPHYFRIGINKDRFLFLPKEIDFKDATKKFRTIINIFYFFTHSILFLILLLPMMKLLNLNPALLIFYLIHIVLDIFTHTDEWRTRLFYPISDLSFSGYTDAWKFSWRELIYTWSFLSGVLIILYFSL